MQDFSYIFKNLVHSSTRFKWGSLYFYNCLFKEANLAKKIYTIKRIYKAFSSSKNRQSYEWLLHSIDCDVYTSEGNKWVYGCLIHNRICGFTWHQNPISIFTWINSKNNPHKHFSARSYCSSSFSAQSLNSPSTQLCSCLVNPVNQALQSMRSNSIANSWFLIQILQDKLEYLAA